MQVLQEQKPVTPLTYIHVGEALIEGNTQNIRSAHGAGSGYFCLGMDYMQKMQEQFFVHW